MHVIVLGLWHLGSVTAACMARFHQVTGLDFDEPVVRNLNEGRAPLHEPGLDVLLAAGLARGNLSFSSDPAISTKADVVWVCYDTPVNAEDMSDVGWVHLRLAVVLRILRPGTVVLISSQLPVGTTRQLAAHYPSLHFGCSPENLRLGRAIDAFEKAARVVVGTSSAAARLVLESMLSPLGVPLMWMRTESAEMVKHALNSFLALSVTFINEIATVAEAVGADAIEIADGLKSDPRIGRAAYLGPGGPFAGGTLARDVTTLTTLAIEHRVPLTLIPAIKESNDLHRGWAFRKLQTLLALQPHAVVAILGLTYTPNTNTLRRSAAVELCRQLQSAGVRIQAFDPLLRIVDVEHRDIPLVATAETAFRGAHAAVICTAYPEFRDYGWAALISNMVTPVILDPNRLVERSVVQIPGVHYISVGRS